METKNLDEILKIIRESYTEEKITKADLISLATSSLMLQTKLQNISKYFVINEVNRTDQEDMVRKFMNENDLNPYYSSRNLSLAEIESGIDNGNLRIYFSDVNGDLVLSLDKDPKFKSSKIFEAFNKYGTYVDANKNHCAEYTSIPLDDLKTVKELIKNNKGVVLIETGLSNNADSDKINRVTIVMTCISEGIETKYYDTFNLYPPKTS